MVSHYDHYLTVLEIKMVKRYFIWDTETTGSRCTDDDIISLGGIICDYRKQRFIPLGEFHSYIYTKKRIDPGAYEVHKISQMDLDGKPSFGVVMMELSVFFKKYTEKGDEIIWIAHNGTRFDDIIFFCNCLQRGCDYYKLMRDCRFYGIIDSLVLIKSLFKGKPATQMPKHVETGRKSFKLEHLHEYFTGQKVIGAHDALVDSRALLDVLNSDAMRLKLNPIVLAKKLNRKDKVFGNLKRSAGLRFKRKINELKGINVKETKKIVSKFYPCFQELEYIHEGLAKRFCLNCVRNVIIDRHVCKLDPSLNKITISK